MLEAVRRNKAMFMVAQVLRFWPEYACLKQVHDKGTYGRLIQGWFSRVCSTPAPDQSYAVLEILNAEQRSARSGRIERSE